MVWRIGIVLRLKRDARELAEVLPLLLRGKLSIGFRLSCAAIQSDIEPIGRALRKSKPVPSTAASVVGISPASVCVYLSALTMRNWPRTLPLASPARFQ